MKRLLLALGVLAGFGLGWVGPRSAFLDVKERTTRLLYDKELVVTGLSLLSRDEALRLAPVANSVLWWRLSGAMVRTALRENPYVADATVRPCEGRWSLNCFHISVTERRPAFLLEVAEKPWVVGEDGGFVAPLPPFPKKGDLDRFLDNEGRSLVLLDGIGREGMSPDLARGRLLYAASALRAIRSEVRLRPRSVELLDSGEMKLTFRDSPLVATFGFAGSDLSPIAAEARRLSALLDTFGERAHLVKTVDLAFDKMAVVKLRTVEKGKGKRSRVS